MQICCQWLYAYLFLFWKERNFFSKLFLLLLLFSINMTKQETILNLVDNKRKVFFLSVKNWFFLLSFFLIIFIFFQFLFFLFIVFFFFMILVLDVCFRIVTEYWKMQQFLLLFLLLLLLLVVLFLLLLQPASNLRRIFKEWTNGNEKGKAILGIWESGSGFILWFYWTVWAISVASLTKPLGFWNFIHYFFSAPFLSLLTHHTSSSFKWMSGQ